MGVRLFYAVPRLEEVLLLWLLGFFLGITLHALA